MSLFRNIGLAASAPASVRDAITPLSKPLEERSYIDDTFIGMSRDRGVVLDDYALFDSDKDKKTTGWF